MMPKGKVHNRPLSIRQAYPKYPSLYQVNTRVYARSPRWGGSGRLDDIPDSELDELRDMGFDWIYLLGVWQSGAAAREIAQAIPELLREYHETLSDLRPEDICGSCFAIQNYRVRRDLGGNAALKRFRKRLSQRGLRLMLDFVPNHTASDHPWVRAHPDYYVHGTPELLAQQPHNYTRLGRAPGAPVLAYGRDPHFPGWSDTLQLNYGNPELRQAMIGELMSVATLCDGVRCDMAMLLLPEVFQRTWGIPAAPFWPRAIQEVRSKYPGFTFVAEVYWDLEWALQQQGFDYTYDKRLYDRLRERQVPPVRQHFEAALDYQDRSVRFLENHDEPRAARVFLPEEHRAAAALTFLSPGLRFFHQGQIQGWKQKIPVQLCRAPQQPIDGRLNAFYMRLLELLRDDILRNGEWQLLECRPAWEANSSWESLIAFSWRGSGDRCWLVAVNYAPHHSQGYMRAPFPEWGGFHMRLNDLFSPASYDRQGDDLLEGGLYVDLPPWGINVFEVLRLSAGAGESL